MTSEGKVGWFMFSGHVTGHLRIVYSGRMIAEDILRFHPELQLILDEIVKMGWKYLYIETKGKAVAEVDLKECPYELDTHDYHNKIEVEMGQKPLEIEDVPEVEEFKINVSTKSYPRAATVDLSKGVVTYLHDAFWGWEKGWEKDSRKLAEAREVYEVVRWLLDIKKLRLDASYSMERCDVLSKLLQKSLGR